jgi:hypothetical protein
MILDAIIALFASLSGGLAITIARLINWLAAGIEAVVCIFVSGFSLGRMEHTTAEPTIHAFFPMGGMLTFLIVMGLLGWLVVTPMVMNRDVTLVADDGHSLPFAALIIRTRDRELHKRTDDVGTLVIPRFTTISISIKDPRYVDKTWSKSEIGSKLVVSRTILGSGLDSIADRFLKPAKD